LVGLDVIPGEYVVVVGWIKHISHSLAYLHRNIGVTPVSPKHRNDIGNFPFMSASKCEGKIWHIRNSRRPFSKSSTQSTSSHPSRSKERTSQHALHRPHPRTCRSGCHRIRMQQLQRLPWPTGLLLYVPVLSLYLLFLFLVIPHPFLSSDMR
jgi:hypothetical protein